MSRVGFIASNNGLGHARRLIHLSKSFADRGYETILFMTDRQYSLIHKETIKLKMKPRNVRIENYGLDGPVWWGLGGDLKRPSKEVTTEIEKCNLVISDNVSWPYEFNQNTVLFGHFTWGDYWQRRVHAQPDLLKKLIIQDINVVTKCPKIFQIQLFALTENLADNVVNIKIQRYHTDQHVLKSNTQEDEFWISLGTTGLGSNTEYLVKKNPKNSFIVRESFYLFDTTKRPSMVIGRPGLGTIRDCLAAGVPFYPVWSSTDPEMQSNVEHLVELGLIFEEIFDQNRLQEFAFTQAQDFFNSKKFTEFDWLKNSDSCDNIAMKISEYI